VNALQIVAFSSPGFFSVTGRFKTGHLWALQNPQVNGC